MNKWNTSNAEDMAQMFKGCKDFNQPLYKWNVRNVVDMTEMFYDCFTFNQSLNPWDLEGVCIYGEYAVKDIFHGCYSLERRNVSTWYIVMGKRNMKMTGFWKI